MKLLIKSQKFQTNLETVTNENVKEIHEKDICPQKKDKKLLMI